MWGSKINSFVKTITNTFRLFIYLIASCFSPNWWWVGNVTHIHGFYHQLYIDGFQIYTLEKMEASFLLDISIYLDNPPENQAIDSKLS